MWHVKRNDSGWDICCFVHNFNGVFTKFANEDDANEWLRKHNKLAPDHINYFCEWVEDDREIC